MKLSLSIPKFTRTSDSLSRLTTMTNKKMKKNQDIESKETVGVQEFVRTKENARHVLQNVPLRTVPELVSNHEYHCTDELRAILLSTCYFLVPFFLPIIFYDQNNNTKMTPFFVIISFSFRFPSSHVVEHLQLLQIT